MSLNISAAIIEIDDHPIEGYTVSFFVGPNLSVPIAWLPPGTHVDQVTGQVLGALADVVRDKLGWPQEQPGYGGTG